MTAMEKAIAQRDRLNERLRYTLLASAIVLGMMAFYTWLHFDDLYAMKLSVYPTLSAIGSLPNIFGLLALGLINGVISHRLGIARQNVALQAFLIITTPQVQTVIDEKPEMVEAFMEAADLPESYSIASLTKMNMRHFMTFARPINKVINLWQEEWVSLSYVVLSLQTSKD
ncbi:hypothetical protein CA267_012920 [Alteromonas pelagimontana]|uniref:Uncharacterized protein n=1 Tax=Alteromonas pelagimontana TaxID=1858656 RepID=A0A6M4MHE8_9ALTE|nr:hypothetical protein [Alteromonas pelagimontana]QJR81606.1 hypothetical protein CA267_012920 [Alteromonas pelagimontana]